jgi:DNA-binding MarR family transcriptional regulator
MYFVSNALARKMEKIAIQSWKPVGLSPSHAYLLMLVIENPGVQPMALSNELQLQPSTITRLMEKLEERKLLVRTYEGKQTNVYPSPKGKEMLPRLRQCTADFFETYSGIIGKEESSRLVQNMSRITDKLEV